MKAARRAAPSNQSARIADRLYLAVLHLLRRMRREDEALGLGAAQLSALTTLVRSGPQTLGELADAEGVRPPTMSRLVRRLEEDGLVVRRSSDVDRRVVRVTHSTRALAVLEKGRAARSASLAKRIQALSAEERKTLEEGLQLLEALSRDD